MPPQGGHTLLFWSGPAWVRSPPTPTHKTCLLSAVGDLKWSLVPLLDCNFKNSEEHWLKSYLDSCKTDSVQSTRLIWKAIPVVTVGLRQYFIVVLWALPNHTSTKMKNTETSWRIKTNGEITTGENAKFSTLFLIWREQFLSCQYCCLNHICFHSMETKIGLNCVFSDICMQRRAFVPNSRKKL